MERKLKMEEKTRYHLDKILIPLFKSKYIIKKGVSKYETAFYLMDFQCACCLQLCVYHQLWFKKMYTSEVILGII